MRRLQAITPRTRTALTALTALAALAVLAGPVALAAPAGAESYRHRDARGDVARTAGSDVQPAAGERRTDVVAIRADYGHQRLRLVIRGADITQHTGGALVNVRSAGTTITAWQPVAGHAPDWFLYNEDDPEFTCDGVIHRADRGGDTILMSIPTRCLGPSVRVAGGLVSGAFAQDRLFVDDAQRRGLGDAEAFSLSPRLSRG